MKKYIFLFIILILLSTTSCRANLLDIKLNDVYFDLEKNNHIDELEEAALKSLGYDSFDYEANHNQNFNLIFNMILPEDSHIEYFMINGCKVKSFNKNNNMYLINFNTKDNYNFLRYHIEYIRYKNDKGYKDYFIDKKYTINIIDNNSFNEAKISNLNIDYTNISLDLSVNDRYRKPNFENLYFYNNYEIFDIKNIKHDNLNCKFEGLSPDTAYDYIVISDYDLGDGNLCQSHELLRGSIKTLSGYKYDDVLIPNNVLYIGNSLINGLNGFGMAAKSSKEDIYYNINEKISKINNDCKFERINFSEAENSNYLDSLKKFEKTYYSYDLVYIFLGDNFSYDGNYLDEFTKMLIYLIKLKNKNARIYWVGGWYWSPDKTNKLLPILEENKIEFINISKFRKKENEANISDIINLDEEITYEMNYESYDYKNNILYIKYKVDAIIYESNIEANAIVERDKILYIKSNKYIIHTSAVATHPSSLGMKKISDEIIEKSGFNFNN